MYRVQEEPFLGKNPKKGNIVDYADMRSTSISKEGALFFSKTNSKPMKYLLEFELPKGTRGIYLAPIKRDKVSKGPFKGEPLAHEMEFLLGKTDVEIIEYCKKTTKGALGEELKIIKLKVIKNGR